jgi:hypothetical protein
VTACTERHTRDGIRNLAREGQKGATKEAQ